MNGSSESGDLKAQIELQVLRTLVRHGPTAFLMSITNAAIVYFVLKGYAIPELLYGWVTCVLCFTLLRLLMVIAFWRMPEGASYTTWTVLYHLLVYCSGLCWGTLALLPVFYNYAWAQGFISFVIAGMSAGGVLALYAKLSAAVPYFCATTLPLIYVLASGSEHQHFGMAILASLFLILLTRSTYSINAVTHRSIRLEIENKELFDFLVEARESQDHALRDFGKQPIDH